MCGIAGFFAERVTPDDRGAVERMVALQHSRGPDHAAVEAIAAAHGQAVLGHNRLAILGLSPAGDQPTWDASRTWCLCYNGEVYNYRELRRELESLGRRFRTTGDTEVVLAALEAWGVEAVDRFRGMFALALLDRRAGRLTLVRDRFGVKPLYYVLGDRTLHFASTPAALADALGLAPDLEHLARGLRYWVFEHGSSAPHLGMRALPPGCRLEARCDADGRIRCRIERYYDLAERVAERADALAALDRRRLIDEVTALVDDAVALRLRSDVPVGVALSGGLDSSSIAASACRQALLVGTPGGPPRGFSFGHPRADESEGPLVERLRRHLGIEVTYVWPSDEGLARAFHGTLAAQGGPLVSGSLVAQYLVFEAARREGYKVLLGGQGGDEVFMGYRKYLLFHVRRLWAERRPIEALAAAAWTLPSLLAQLPGAADYWRCRHRYTRRRGIDTALLLPEPEPLELGYSSDEPLGTRQMLDVTLLSLPTLLQYEDRNGMAHGVESRLPLVDHRVVEFGLALSEAMKLRRGWGKWILRETARGRIPESIREARSKRGFSVPQDAWIDRVLGRLIRQMLHDDARFIRTWLDPHAAIDELFSNDQLKRRPGALGEATALLWLAGQENRRLGDCACSTGLAQQEPRVPLAARQPVRECPSGGQPSSPLPPGEGQGDGMSAYTSAATRVAS